MRTIAVLVCSALLCTWICANDNPVAANELSPELITFYLHNFYVNLGDEAVAIEEYETALTAYATLIAIGNDEQVDPQLLLRAYRGAGRIYMKYAVNDRAADCFRRAQKIESDPEILRLLLQVSAAAMESN